MTVSKGAYDEVCTFVRAHTQADAVVLLVIGGSAGTAGSVVTREADLAKSARGIAKKLHEMADALEADVAELEAEARGKMS